MCMDLSTSAALRFVHGQIAVWTCCVGRAWRRVQAFAVRLAGVQLLELVQRSGSVAPWLFLPPLLALATDVRPEIADKAVAVLRHCAAKTVRPPPLPGRIHDLATCHVATPG